MAKASKRKAVEVVEEKKLILQQDELVKVETSPLIVANAKLLMAVEEQSLANMNLELKLLLNKIEKQKAVLVECDSRLKLEKEKHSFIIGNIIKNYSLESDKFSYNPITGEIIL